MTDKNNGDNIVDIQEERKKPRKKAAALKGEVVASSAEIELEGQAKLEEMNKNHAFIESFGGKPVVTVNIYNEVFRTEIMDFMSPDNFAQIYSNRSVNVDGKPMPMGKWWLGQEFRRTYRTVIFDPSKPREINGNLNLWEGFKTKPVYKKFGWRKTMKHIHRILCERDKEKFDYVIKWLAWCVQNPDKRAEVAVIFKGKEGAGKGFIFTQFTYLFGQHGMTIANRELLTGKHNGHFSKIVFLFADEAYYPGDKEVEGVMKQLITEPSIAYRSMYKDAIMGLNRLHIGMATNNDWVINATGDSRRYFINAVDNTYAKGQCPDHVRNQYFEGLWEEMRDMGREAMLYDLLNMDLKGFHPRKNVPETIEMRRQKQLSLSRLHTAVLHVLEAGYIPGQLDTRNRMYVTASQFYRLLNDKDEYVKKFSENKKAEMLRSLDIEKERHADGMRYYFPSLEATRKRWDKVYGEHDWENINDQWQIMKYSY